MNVAHYVIDTLFSQCVFDDGLEGFFLLWRRNRLDTAKQLLGNVRAELFCVFGLVQQTVNIRIAILKCRE